MSVPTQAPSWRAVSSWTRKLVAKVMDRAESHPADRPPMTFRITLERDELDGGWVAESLDFPGVVSEGETQHEAIQNVLDAISEALAVRMREHTPTLEPDNIAPNHAEFAVTA